MWPTPSARRSRAGGRCALPSNRYPPQSMTMTVPTAGDRRRASGLSAAEVAAASQTINRSDHRGEGKHRRGHGNLQALDVLHPVRFEKVFLGRGRATAIAEGTGTCPCRRRTWGQLSGWAERGGHRPPTQGSLPLGTPPICVPRGSWSSPFSRSGRAGRRATRASSRVKMAVRTIRQTESEDATPQSNVSRTWKSTRFASSCRCVRRGGPA